MQQQKSKGPFRAQRTTASPFDFFTGGKTADFAIYFNMAQDNIDEIIAKLEGAAKDISVEVIEKDETFIALRNYLWKGFEFNKNKAGYSITEDDKELIKNLLRRLNELRNFHSHVWHDNAAVELDKQLVNFIREKADIALTEAKGKFSRDDIEFYEDNLQKIPHIKDDRGKNFLTQEGRCFFLSFFLTKGQMNSFLQQRSGSKRNDMTAFKVKRDVYTYYCHHDGASVTGHHINESAFDELLYEEQREILKARQAYKIISYLNDIPEVLTDTTAIPFYITENNTLRPCDSVQDLVSFSQQKGFFRSLQFTEITVEKKNLETDEKETIIREGLIDCRHTAIVDYGFRISRMHLHKLIIQRILKGEDYEQFLFDKLNSFAGERRKLFSFLTQLYHNKPSADGTVTMTDDDLKGFIIRGEAKLQNSYKQWLDGWQKDRNPSAQATWNLINKIRPFDTAAIRQLSNLAFGRNRPTHEPAEAEPILLLNQYFFMGEESFSEEVNETETIPKIRLQQKPRAENNFVRYVAHFLIENKLVKDWKWLFETFKTEEEIDKETGEPKQVNKRFTLFSADIPKGYRLAIFNNQVVVAVQKPGKDNDIKRNNWIFGFGNNALRYIISCYFLNNKNAAGLNDFLLQLKDDMEKLHGWCNGSEPPVYELLEEQYIPPFYAKLRKTISSTPVNTSRNAELLVDLKKQVKQRVDFICKELQDVLSNKHQLRRAEKNRLVMRCYKYFDWSNTADKKFLRQNEYNEMSVCHYLLNDERKFRNMYEVVFKLNRRVPVEVNELLRTARNLDELLTTVTAQTIGYLKGKVGTITDIDVAKVLKQELVPFARTIGLPVNENLLPSADFAKLGEKHKDTMDVLPFDIHPNLVLKFFYKEKYAEKYFKYNSLYKELDTAGNKKGLFMAHYAVDNLKSLYKEQEKIPAAAKEGTSSKKNEAVLAKEKIVGEINTCQTEDILLWQIARQYLQTGNYTSPRATDIIKCIAADVNTVNVKNLHTELVTLPVSKGDKPVYYIKLRMHQLDDLLFQANQQKLHDAITHYCNRKEEEQASYSKPLVHDAAITLDEVYREIMRVQRDGMVTGKHLLDWELNVINTYCQQQNTTAPEQKQQLLIAKWNQLNKRGKARLDFWRILEMAVEAKLLDETAVSKNEINELRKTILHSHVPVNGSYKSKTMMEADKPTALGQLLHIHEPVDTKKDRSMYEQNNEESKP